MTMTRVNAYSKKGSSWINAYNRATARELREVYDRFSWNKQKAYASCTNKCYFDNGRDFRIISYNTFGFTCGYKMPNGDLKVFTKDNTYLIV